MNGSDEREEIKNIPPLPLPAARIAGLAQLQANIILRPGDVRYTKPLLHPTTPPKEKNSISYAASVLLVLLLDITSMYYDCNTV